MSETLVLAYMPSRWRCPNGHEFTRELIDGSNPPNLLSYHADADGKVWGTGDLCMPCVIEWMTRTFPRLERVEEAKP